MPRKHAILPVIVILLASILACNLPIAANPASADLTVTAAVKTIEFNLTATSVLLSLTPRTSTPTTVFTNTPVPPSNTPRPPTQTPVPPTPQTRCNWADFIADISIPDGTRLTPGKTFTKTWRLKNIGTCTWTSEYSIAFESGDAMGAPQAVALPEIVPPGDTVDVSVNLTAPATPGRKTGYWKLRNPAGVPFGLGYDAQSAFYVQVEVISGTGTPTATPTKGPAGVTYDFAANYCFAQWRTDAGVLDCEANDTTDSRGFVIRLDNPMLENGDTKTRPGLWTHPEWKTNGVISGRYPAFNVQAGDRFQATIACLYDALACNVKFQLNYRANGGDLKRMGEWDQLYEGAVQNLDIDLTPWAGQSVEFVLAVLAVDSPDQDWALWWWPRIMR